MKDNDSPAPDETFNANFYPEVARHDSLTAAIDAKARSRGVVLAKLRPFNSPERLHDSALVETERGRMEVRLGQGERRFHVQFDAGETVRGSGESENFEDIVGVLAAWGSGMRLREIHARFPFLEPKSELAVAVDEGTGIEYQWSRVPDDAIRGYRSEALRAVALAAGRSAILRRFCPHLSMGTMFLSMNPANLRMRQLGFSPLRDGTILVEDYATSLRLVAAQTPEEAVAVAERMAEAALRAADEGTLGNQGWILQLHPTLGIGSLLFRHEFRVAVSMTDRYGEARATEWAAPGLSEERGRAIKAAVTAEPFGMVLAADDAYRLGAVEVFPPREDIFPNTKVTVRYEDFDVFRTPARELAERVRSLGRDVVWETGERFAVPEDALVVYRQPGEGVELDPEDGLAVYPTSVLVATLEHFEQRVEQS